MGWGFRKHNQDNCGFKWGEARVSDVRGDDHKVSQTESCGELLAAVEPSGVSADMTLEEFVAIDENIATESMDVWEEDFVRSYIKRMKDSDGDDGDNDGSDDDDDKVIIMSESVLTIRKAYSIASKLQWLQENDLASIVDKLVSKLEKKLVEEKLKGIRQRSLKDLLQPVCLCKAYMLFIYEKVFCIMYMCQMKKNVMHKIF